MTLQTKRGELFESSQIVVMLLRKMKNTLDRSERFFYAKDASVEKQNLFVSIFQCNDVYIDIRPLTASLLLHYCP